MYKQGIMKTETINFCVTGLKRLINKYIWRMDVTKPEISLTPEALVFLYNSRKEYTTIPWTDIQEIKFIEDEFGKAIIPVVYDPQNVTYKSKDVKLNCFLRAASLTEFWRSYDAFLYDLIRPEERTLYVSEIEEEFLFYYKSCQTKNFFPDDGKIWFEFTLTVTFTEQFRILQGDMVLASESNICIETEDGGYLIDMQPDSKYFPDE